MRAILATRLQILKLKPNMINNWVAFAVAQHLVKISDISERRLWATFQSYFIYLKSRPSAELKPIETSHYFIYRVIACLDA